MRYADDNHKGLDMTEELNRSAKPELWIYLFLGLTPNTLIKMGYPKGTVYKYSAQMPFLRKKVLDRLEVGK